MKLFNKRGDGGETSLLFGGRVPKSDLRTETYGTLDEAASALGLGRALSKRDRVKEIVLEVQKEIFVVGAELATKDEDLDRLTEKIGEPHVDKLQTLIEEIEERIELPKEFIIPGANSSSAALDLARTIIRRGERRAVALKEAETLKNMEILRYLNRLADLVFVLARFEELEG
jgi:cob(I)alamin adenosyltransferase